MKTHEVIVVGAGAAGLSCARALTEAGADFVLLEARSRIGGRVFSVQDSVYKNALELGAEFIHGAPPVIFDELNRYHIPFYDLKDKHAALKNGRLKPDPEFWEKLEREMPRVMRTKRDYSVDEFMHMKKHLGRAQRDAFKGYIEGFEAADLRRMSRRALAEASADDEGELGGVGLFKTSRAYHEIFERVADALPRGTLQLESVVAKIESEKRGWKLTVNEGPARRPVTYRARNLVLTLPIGVLKSKAIAWPDRPRELTTALAGVEMGHVQRLVLRFRERFWENLFEDETISFMHGPADGYFPTWWSLQPIRTPHLIAWQGGPKAEAIAGMPIREKISLAFKSLSRLTGRSVTFLNSQMEAFHAHDWSDDAFAQGAYSYVGVGGLEKSRRLARPFPSGLYLAGEGTASGSDRGTVHGAFASGVKAAKAVLKK